MNLPRKELLKDSNNRIEMEVLINQAESALRTWQPIWSLFISAPLREEAFKIMAPLNNLYWQADGGHPGAERQRLQCIRYEDEIAIGALQTPSIFGTGTVFGSAIFGGTLYPQQKTTLTGSGFTNNFRIRSTGTASPYTVSGFYVDFIPAGRT